MVRSKYSLVPQGHGLHIYRLLESMSAGAVPVIISDHFVLPFSEILDWNSFSIVIKQDDIDSIPRVLDNISPSKYEYMQKNVVMVYENYFSSYYQVMTRIVEMLKDRIEKAVKDNLS